MERLTERTQDGIFAKEDYGEESLKTLYQRYGAEPMPHYVNCDEGYCAMDRLAEYEDLEDRLRSVYGECDGLLEKVVELLERHEGIDLAEPVFKARLLTDGEADKWEEYKKLEEQGKLLKLPYDMVWFICDRKTKYATVMSKSIRDIAIYEIEGIDKKGYYWSTRDKALAAMKEL